MLTFFSSINGFRDIQFLSDVWCYYSVSIWYITQYYVTIKTSILHVLKWRIPYYYVQCALKGLFWIGPIKIWFVLDKIFKDNKGYFLWCDYDKTIDILCKSHETSNVYQTISTILRMSPISSKGSWCIRETVVCCNSISIIRIKPHIYRHPPPLT